MEKDNVIQKIQKLLKLQYGAEKVGSTGEAYQAAKKVRKLLMEYNLSMNDIDTSEGEQKPTMSKSEEKSSGSMYGNHWKFALLGVIANNNLCHAYKRMNGKMFVIGTEDNVTVVQEFYDYLMKVFRRLAKEHWEKEQKELNKEIGFFVTNWDLIKNKYIRSYLEGVPIGLQENYNSLKPTSQEAALVICHQDAINEYVQENFEWSDSKTRKRKRAVYGNAFDLGAADGRAVSLNRQLQETMRPFLK